MSAVAEVVVLHYKRPENIRPILSAFRGQTAPIKLTLIDAHAEGFGLDASTIALADNVVAFQHNSGSFMRYAPAFTYDQAFTYFHDDDMVPGRRAIEHFMNHADRLPDFGMLGQFGRYSSSGAYHPKGVARIAGYRHVDSVVRGYFIRSAHLHHVLRLRWRIEWDGAIEDDLLAACAMRLYGRLPILLTPVAKDPEESICVRGLPSPYALSDRRDHLHRRTEFVRQMHRIGWRSVRDGTTVRNAPVNADVSETA